VDEFKATFEKKVDGKIREEKPLASTLGIHRGCKFIITILSQRMIVFKFIQTGRIVFQSCIDSQNLFVSTFQIEPFPT
jgi:hypothetical protein